MIQDINLYKKLTTGQILNWRLNTYNFIGQSRKYSAEEMLDYMDIEIKDTNSIEQLNNSFINKEIHLIINKLNELSLDDNYDYDMENDDDVMMMEQIYEEKNFTNLQYTESIISNLCLNPINVSQLYFLKFDSSYISKYNIETVIQNFKNNAQLPTNSIIIFVLDHISYVESLYKLNCSIKNKYSDTVKQNSLLYINLCNDEDKIIKLGFDHIFKISIIRLNEILMKLELNALELQQTIVDDKISKIEKSGKKVQNLYNIYQNSYPAMRNEINDDAQLHILKDIKNSFPGSNQIMFTCDKSLMDKCIENDIIVINN